MKESVDRLSAIHKLKANRWLKSLPVSRFNVPEEQKSSEEQIHCLTNQFPDLKVDPETIDDIIHTMNDVDNRLTNDLNIESDFINIIHVNVCTMIIYNLILY